MPHRLKPQRSFKLARNCPPSSLHAFLHKPEHDTTYEHLPTNRVTPNIGPHETFSQEQLFDDQVAYRTFVEGPVTYTVAGDAETSSGAGAVYVFRGSLTPGRLVLTVTGAGTGYPSGVYTGAYVGRSSRWRQEFARRAVGVYREHVGAIRECGQ